MVRGSKVRSRLGIQRCRFDAGAVADSRRRPVVKVPSTACSCDTMALLSACARVHFSRVHCCSDVRPRVAQKIRRTEQVIMQRQFLAPGQALESPGEQRSTDDRRRHRHTMQTRFDHPTGNAGRSIASRPCVRQDNTRLPRALEREAKERGRRCAGLSLSLTRRGPQKRMWSGAPRTSNTWRPPRSMKLGSGFAPKVTPCTLSVPSYSKSQRLPSWSSMRSIRPSSS